MNKENSVKRVNWIAVISGIVVIASAFLPYYTEGLGRIGGRFTKTLIEIGSGYVLILLAALAILFALIKKKTPFVVFTILTTVLEGIMFFVTLSDMQYSTDPVFNYGFYLSIAGALLLLLASPIHNAIQERTTKQ